MKNLKISRKSLVNSRKFNNRDFKLFRHSELGSESIPCCKLTVLAGKILKQVQDDCYDNNHNELTTNDLLLSTKAFGFTMAEILLSLTIIGVVAAITLPSLTGNINERTWNTQRKALLSRMSQAVALMPTMNNYGTTDDNASETFITAGLSKVLKINNICGYGTDGSGLFDCGLASQIVDTDGTKKDLPNQMNDLNNGIINYNSPVSIRNTKAVAFETGNGEAVLAFYNPNCTAGNVLIPGADGSGTEGMVIKQHLCLNFIYDLNGKKGPNTVGKDIGNMAVFYSSDPKVVMPMYPKSLSGTKTYDETVQACRELGQNGEYRMPNIEEVMSVYYNKVLYPSAMPESGDIWSGTVSDTTHAYAYGNRTGIRFNFAKTNPNHGFCVQR